MLRTGNLERDSLVQGRMWEKSLDRQENDRNVLPEPWEMALAGLVTVKVGLPF